MYLASATGPFGLGCPELPLQIVPQVTSVGDDVALIDPRTPGFPDMVGLVRDVAVMEDWYQDRGVSDVFTREFASFIGV